MTITVLWNEQLLYEIYCNAFWKPVPTVKTHLDETLRLHNAPLLLQPSGCLQEWEWIEILAFAASHPFVRHRKDIAGLGYSGFEPCGWVADASLRR